MSPVPNVKRMCLSFGHRASLVSLQGQASPLSLLDGAFGFTRLMSAAPTLGQYPLDTLEHSVLHNFHFYLQFLVMYFYHVIVETVYLYT